MATRLAFPTATFTVQGLARFSSSPGKFGPRNNHAEIAKWPSPPAANPNVNGNDNTENYLYTILTEKRCKYSGYWVDYKREEVEASSAQQSVKRDSQRICSILNEGLEDYDAFEQKLAPFISRLSPELVCRVIGSTSISTSASARPTMSFFFWAQHQPGYRHNSATFDAAIQFAAKSRDFQLMSTLLKECKRWGFSFTPKTFSFVAVEGGALKSPMLGAVLRSIHEMNRWNTRGKNRDAFDALTSTLCNANHLDAALEVLRGMVSAGFCLTAHTYNILVTALCREDRLDDAKLLIKHMRDKGSCPTTITYNRLLKAYIEKDRLREASELVDSMTEAGCTADSFTYTQLIDFACRNRLPYMGLKLLRKMEYSGFKPMQAAYNTLVKCFESLGQFDEADKLIAESEKKGYENTA
ncbi:hypothetical protein SUGI_0166570 [Cryptomeria japonica]|uniref:pentatricopeptide repeat-containing protein At3g53700, chloroplastic n=1 Tax=Cryptomeria japonica TaxID=3369 RepID=UPI002408B7D4|nr:pentatricopeptide repeat-containing protein At3g53700, chloroplastic [Cryptomeria japonica]XP_057818764.2 pentatricopeptide repeat-containing protein At3g53700, chloroplastic [Cryptomeria japonica]GLJ11411.1 hypothetical protein SUGI_0166570 [Cryptomeria japonica]